MKSDYERQQELKRNKPYVYDKVKKYGMRIVRLEYDYACNFNCVHCCAKEYRGKLSDRRALTVDDVKDIALQSDELGFSQFVISGGEPLVYPDLFNVIEAIDPQRFYITTDTNGWRLDNETARWLKSWGVDKVQISIDSAVPYLHDELRNKKKSYKRAIEAIGNVQANGMYALIQTVVDKKRAMDFELEVFIHTMNEYNCPVCILYAKPVGGWAGRDDLMLDQSDIDYVESLCKKYSAFSHLTPTGECIAVKRMINIMKWGDVNPCPVMQEYSIGNIFEESLAVILKRGMDKFCGHIPVCVVAQENDWKKYVEAL